MAINIIKYITKNTELKQKDIAIKMGVTTGQVSKWKNGEHISNDRKKELNKLAGLFGDDSEWAVLVKNEENAEAWFEFFKYKDQDQENPIFNYEEEEISVPYLLILLSNLGVKIPKKAPSIAFYEEVFDLEDGLIDEKDFDNSIDRNLDFHELISDVLDSYGPTLEWSHLMFINDNINSDSLTGYEITDHSLDIGLASIDRDIFSDLGGDISKLETHIKETKVRLNTLIHRFCSELLNNNIPITHDYFELTEGYSGRLQNEVERINFSKSHLRGEHRITDYLSYSDNVLMNSAKSSNVLLESLNRKLDTLLSAENKKRFMDDPDNLMEDT